ncbi:MULTISPECIES: hypothetical protein [unclassified Breznakia]|uniref:hypothetical protein n=1 Tax=unclassified Breznakia TaxID=2623764 RepID=UPI00247369F7|nr:MULTISPECIES: hypothetical protein [unclassified Breznakia]MDH6367149.1 hypothetical protein [Breznakia sp. PH1-1]MDH6404264.1 hypothetical protein [Breznakia sp. PF1-11]MDH6412037.1 hypothetical protein [Breznakia sp. PFB1-11]MDH6414252.1 hypothetical protein [Breznakia sp. PFB1-14]MDH6416651.1 hypothetical protein [Breznakia sp. PFB1-4]
MNDKKLQEANRLRAEIIKLEETIYSIKHAIRYEYDLHFKSGQSREYKTRIPCEVLKAVAPIMLEMLQKKYDALAKDFEKL